MSYTQRVELMNFYFGRLKRENKKLMERRKLKINNGLLGT